MINKMDEQKKVKDEEGKNNYRRLRNELKRGTDQAKKESLESVCDEIKEFRRAGCYDLIHMKKKELGWKENHGIQNTGIEDSTGDIIVDKRQAPNIWENHIMELYDRPNRQENLEVETEEEVDAEEKDLIFCEVKWKKPSRK